MESIDYVISVAVIRGEVDDVSGDDDVEEKPYDEVDPYRRDNVDWRATGIADKNCVLNSPCPRSDSRPA